MYKRAFFLSFSFLKEMAILVIKVIKIQAPPHQSNSLYNNQLIIMITKKNFKVNKIFMYKISFKV